MSTRSSRPTINVTSTATASPFDVGLAAVRELQGLLDPGVTLAQFALRWVIDQPGVSTVIPGASSPEQVLQNIAAASLEPLREEQISGVREVYDRLIRKHVHASW